MFSNQIREFIARFFTSLRSLIPSLETWAEENLVYNTARNKKNIDSLTWEYRMRYLSAIKIYLKRKEKPERRETHGFLNEKAKKVSVKRKQFVEFLLWSSSVTRENDDCRRNIFNCVINICKQVNYIEKKERKRKENLKKAKVIRRNIPEAKENIEESERKVINWKCVISFLVPVQCGKILYKYLHIYLHKRRRRRKSSFNAKRPFVYFFTQPEGIILHEHSINWKCFQVFLFYFLHNNNNKNQWNSESLKELFKNHRTKK